jgi:hypothetical protein
MSAWCRGCRPVLCGVLWGRQVPGVVGTLCCVRTILWQLTQVVQSGEQRRVCCWWVDCHSRVWSDAILCEARGARGQCGVKHANRATSTQWWLRVVQHQCIPYQVCRQHTAPWAAAAHSMQALQPLHLQ